MWKIAAARIVEEWQLLPQHPDDIPQSSLSLSSSHISRSHAQTSSLSLSLSLTQILFYTVSTRRENIIRTNLVAAISLLSLLTQP
ncbi:hypothetical protein CMV_009520 [Castanea mollissima]|uniref:Uncharacterized protein n=1 Tax=Castanea mollissima TaxID=60419 RepID=A0A8J4R5J0_9ROSI|nr:hypothetical protein CMV_009520 [Castanea mollissima]